MTTDELNRQLGPAFYAAVQRARRHSWRIVKRCVWGAVLWLDGNPDAARELCIDREGKVEAW